MIWTTKIPTEPGCYLWKEIGEKNRFSKLCVIYEYEKELFFEIIPSNSLNFKRYKLSKTAAREWLKIPD